MIGPHVCHVYGCGVKVPPALLACRKHWRKIPHELRREVLRHYRPGQCEDRRPSEEYLDAARAAVCYVEKLELRARRLIPQNESEARE